jgi:hypothetical protein
MKNSNLILVYGTILFLVVTSLSLSALPEEDTPPHWKKDWSYQKQLQIPILTNNTHAKYQPIDIHVKFENPCWTINETETSIRICCWDGLEWHELESQIYDLQKTNSETVEECSIVFLIPDFADGTEQYYMYYDDTKKETPKYADHITIEDLYYYSTPISDISAEAKYYGIRENGYCLYGIGQEGKLLDRSFSQVIVKLKRETENFDLLDADQVQSFAFSYHYGSEEHEESSSDQSFVHKKIFVDGNLMIEFGIISESDKKDIRTTAIYKYYYSPLEDKRLCIRVKHQMFSDAIVSGITNIDGRFGTMISIRSHNPAINLLNFGEIYPYLHFHGKHNTVEEYQMNLDPETKKREWIVSYKDDADVGEEAWIAYGEGKQGKTHAIIFSDNKVLLSGTDERDGIQIKAAEREYFNFLSAEIDYVSINFGRNSYEKGYGHDVEIPGDLTIEFDAEMFISEQGGYEKVRREAVLFQELVKHRSLPEKPSFEQEKKKHDLKIVTHFGGSRFTYPRLANRTYQIFPVLWIEVVQDGKVIHSGAAQKSFFMKSRSIKLFPKVTEGTYLVKVFWMIDNETKFFRGAKVVTLNEKKNCSCPMYLATISSVHFS